MLIIEIHAPLLAQLIDPC